MIVSLVELLPDLPDVGGNNHQVSVGETNQYIPIPIPSDERKKGELIFIQISHCHDSMSLFGVAVRV